MVRRRTARGSLGREDKSAQMYSAFGWRSALLAMMHSCSIIGIKRKKDKVAEKDITKQNTRVLVGFRNAYQLPRNSVVP